MQTFSLTPFTAKKSPTIEIFGKICRIRNQLSIKFHIHGDVKHLVIPSTSASPLRKDDLWKATCFEFFLAIPNQPEYWEFNMSPAGDWNVYKMDTYRRVGFREEKAITNLPFHFHADNTSISLELTVDLKPLFREKQSLQAGITAIIQTDDGNETYWALTHPAPRADFHLRDSFILFL